MPYFPTVDLSTLTAQQLSQLQQRLSQELEHLTQSHTKLRLAQQKFRECIKSIETGVRDQEDGRKHYKKSLCRLQV